MTVRVLIEREVEAGQEAKLQQILSQTRVQALKAKGYISGETLRSLENPSKFLVISNWTSLEGWKAWEKDPERAKMQQELAPLLVGKERCSIFAHF